MTTTDTSDASLQEKLQKQVSSSVREALEKSTTILSNLHRLSSFLDVMSSMVPSSDRIRNSHEQIQNIRADCASLLQTIYLGEIGLQSLQDMGKTGTFSGMIPIFSDALTSGIITSSNSITDTIQNESIFDEDGSTITLGKRNANDNLEEQPNSKKSTVAVFACNGCGRKFATNVEPGQVPSHCHNCRDSGAPTMAINISESPQAVTTISSPILNSTPVVNPRKQSKRIGKRGKLLPLVCKLCGISFFYRRCLLRHLRENHTGIVDINNLQEYIDMSTNSSVEPTSPSSSQPSSLDVTIGSELETSNTDYSLENVSTTETTNEEGLPSTTNTSSNTTSLIEAVQNQAILEQASILLTAQNTGSDDNQSCNNDSTLLGQNESASEINIGGMKVTTTLRTEDGTTFREFKCTVCNKSFDRPYRLTRHLEIHDPNRPRIPCSYCSKTFTRKDSLESHIKTVHAAVHPYICGHDRCQRSFATRSMYLNHLKVHGDSKPYHCQECDECFTLLTEMKDHFKKVHPENESLRCNECFKVCSSTEDLEEHKLRDHRFECEICGKIFARLAYLQVHVKVHNGGSKFNCRFCSEGYDSAYAYRQHMKNHPEYRRITNVFPCHTCGKVFQDPSNLVAHYQTQEHREKAAAVGPPSGPSTATSLMEGDLSLMSHLITHVVMNESDEIINHIVNAQDGYEEISTSQPESQQGRE